jgi:hypothetical protein
MDSQLPLALAILLGCFVVGWLMVRGGADVRKWWAILLIAATMIQVARIYAGT